jgi:hypothetical protein
MSFLYTVNEADDDDKLNTPSTNNYADDDLQETVNSLTETMVTLMDESTSFTYILKKVVEAVDILSFTGSLKKKCVIQTLQAIYGSKEQLPISYDILDRLIDLIISASKGRLRLNQSQSQERQRPNQQSRGINAKKKRKSCFCWF